VNKGMSSMARSSEERELDRLVSEHLPTALRFATRLTGDVDQAEDVVQEVFLKVHRGIESFRGEAEFSSWGFVAKFWE
jgi:RNA polymerase sigma-70 factor (ECF subfamily)